MAIYRTIQMTFWTDSKVIDDFTPEDRYFYLYLMTNPHTNLAGCYELSMTQMATETGYTKETIGKLIERMETKHNVIRYSLVTKEVLIMNWNKYNWTSSPKFRIPLQKEIESVKNVDFKAFLEGLLYGNDTVSIPYQYGSDTTVTVTDNIVEPLLSVNPLDKQEVKPNKRSKSNNNTNIYILLDESDIDEEVKESVKEWLDYKKEQFKFSYQPTGFKKFLTEIQNNVNELGIKNVCRAIDLSMGKGYKGIIWDLVKEKQGNSSPYMDAIKNRVSIVDSW